MHRFSTSSGSYSVSVRHVQRRYLIAVRCSHISITLPHSQLTERLRAKARIIARHLSLAGTQVTPRDHLPIQCPVPELRITGFFWAMASTSPMSAACTDERCSILKGIYGTRYRGWWGKSWTENTHWWTSRAVSIHIGLLRARRRRTYRGKRSVRWPKSDSKTPFRANKSNAFLYELILWELWCWWRVFFHWNPQTKADLSLRRNRLLDVKSSMDFRQGLRNKSSTDDVKFFIRHHSSGENWGAHELHCNRNVENCQNAWFMHAKR